MKYIGIILLLCAAYTVSRDFSRYMSKRSSECKGFLDFIAHMRIQVGCFLRPIRELDLGFYSKPLAEVGFLDSLKRCEDIFEAYNQCEPSLSLSKEEREALSRFFSSFGTGYLDEGIRLIDSAYAEMEKLYEGLSEEKKKNTRLVTALSVTAVLGILIFII